MFYKVIWVITLRRIHRENGVLRHLTVWIADISSVTGVESMRAEHGHGNQIQTHRAAPRYKPTIRKVPADSVPYGESISRNGRTVWAAYDGETLVVVAATADEARCKYREVRKAREREERQKRVAGG
jgi:hypothetical protein